MLTFRNLCITETVLASAKIRHTLTTTGHSPQPGDEVLRRQRSDEVPGGEATRSTSSSQVGASPSKRSTVRLRVCRRCRRIGTRIVFRPTTPEG